MKNDLFEGNTHGHDLTKDRNFSSGNCKISYQGENLENHDKLAPILIIDSNLENMVSLQTLIGLRFHLNASMCSSGYLALRYFK